MTGGGTMKSRKAAEIVDALLKDMNFGSRSLPDGFEENMHLKFKNAGSRHKSYFLKPALAFSALILVFIAGFGAGTISGNKNDEDQELHELFEHSVIASAEVRTGETVTIKLVYDSEKDVEDVDFSITLPEGLAFNSSNPEISSEKTISWTGTLKKGKNEIPFVVKAVMEGSWQIDATAEYDDGILTHEIMVKAANDLKTSAGGKMNV